MEVLLRKLDRPLHASSADISAQVYIVILVIECLCIYFLFVETKGELLNTCKAHQYDNANPRLPGPTLEEIATLFDGDSAAVVNEDTLAESTHEKSMAIEKTSQVEKVDN